MSISTAQLSEAAAISLNGGTETAWRACVHQAYYALFHHTLLLANVFLNAGIEGGSQHEQLYRFMRHHRNGGFREIGQALMAATALRVRADYRLNEDLSFAEADGHLASCCRYLEKVEQYIQRFSEQSEK